MSVEHLKAKVDAGLDVVITQLFYDNAYYFAFVERARRAGIDVPLVAGIMPITNARQIQRITQLSGNAGAAGARRGGSSAPATIPRPGWRSASSTARASAPSCCVPACPGIHFYTLNQSPATRAIFENLRREGLV